MRILLGGIPLGCDNVGDEAILVCVVQKLRARFPSAELTVATADPSTADWLGVAVTKPWGFVDAGCDGFDEVVRKHDRYIWCGATGLSDYPHVALTLLDRAQAAGVPSFVWGVGMDSELNPVFFRAAGRRLKLLSLFGLVGAYESLLRVRLGRRLRHTLSRCCGVWLRDPQSADCLRAFGVEPTGVTADTALFLEPSGPPEFPRCSDMKTFGLCISAQRAVKDRVGLLRFLGKVLAHKGVRIIGIPMNPKTDRALMDALAEELGRPANFLMSTAPASAPQRVAAQAQACDLVLSSRLHLLILSATAGTPVMGLARGSKLENWLSNFGQKTEGSVQACDWDALAVRVLSVLDDPHARESFASVREPAYARLRSRFNVAFDALATALEQGAK